jgi:hypothetical protein
MVPTRDAYGRSGHARPRVRLTRLAGVSTRSAVEAAWRLAESSAVGALLAVAPAGEAALLGAFQEPGRSGAREEVRGPCGGRSAFAGEGVVLWWALVAEPSEWGIEAGLSGPRCLNRLVRGALAGLTQIGVRPSYPGRDFVAAAGRRVAQLSLGRGAGGGLLFQAVVAATRPFATAEPAPEYPGLPALPPAGALGIEPQAVCSALSAGFAEQFALELAPAEPSADELRALAATPLPALDDPELAGLRAGGFVATPIGRLAAHVALRDDGSLDRVRLRGDWIAAREPLRALERSLAGRRADDPALRELCARWLAAPESGVVGLTDPGALVEALERSARAAR